MNQLVYASVLALMISVITYAQPMEYTTITVVESIVPSRFGRSRMISTRENRDYKEFTSMRTEEDDSRNKSDRGEIRVKNFEETKLLNFFNLGGIRFQNIAANDALVTSKLNALADEGWVLGFVFGGVESSAGEEANNGILTRYIICRTKKLNS
jgi:hypothetical protein